ncbi:subunit 17 of mediator complex-domain-containing protein [Peziza echinospora]|nr:subunit 17 of mediator complex-domain-containing protein [Peziza echinospora]
MDESDHLLLSLKSWPSPDPATTSIQALLPRIQQERGSFRDTTEASLEAEIAAGFDMTTEGQANESAGKAKAGDGSGTAVVEDELAQEKAAAEALALGRAEIIHEITSAHNEAMIALDFISLMVSLNNPELGFTTMSPGLKEVVPLGSMGIEKVHTKYPPALTQEERLVCQGWKLEGLNSAADSMMNAAKRLKVETEKETRYWKQILSIRDEGWTICKLPRERNTLGVRYGFAEAAPEFKERGVGALRRAEDGSIDMEDINASRAARRAVRVRIVDNGKVTGVSRPSGNRAIKPTLKDKIETARDFIYEDELFFEIMREARNLANLGIKTSESLATIELKQGRSVQIDMAPIDEDPITTGPSDPLAQAIALALRLLLSYGHRNNLRRRSKPQPPMVPRKPPNPPLHLLRPIAIHLLHQESTAHFLQLCDHLRALTVSTGLLPASTTATTTTTSATDPSSFLTLHPLKNIPIHHKQPTTTKTTTSSSSSSSTTTNSQKEIEALLEVFLSRLETEAILSFPGAWRLSIFIRTIITHPYYGTGYIITPTHDGVCAQLTGRTNIADQAELESHLMWCLERSVVNAIRLEMGDTWKQLAQGNSMEKSDGKTVKKITVHVGRSGLHLRWGMVGGRDKEYVWNGQGEGGEKTLWEVLREI